MRGTVQLSLRRRTTENYPSRTELHRRMPRMPQRRAAHDEESGQEATALSRRKNHRPVRPPVTRVYRLPREIRRRELAAPQADGRGRLHFLSRNHGQETRLSPAYRPAVHASGRRHVVRRLPRQTDTAGIKSATFAFKASPIESCGKCHEKARDHFAGSAHGHALTVKAANALDCLTCHRQPIVALAPTKPTLAQKLA